MNFIKCLLFFLVIAAYTQVRGQASGNYYVIDPNTLCNITSGTSSTFNWGVKFGATSSGEVIASNKVGGGNIGGLDFYTAYNKRLSITNTTGYVGIGLVPSQDPAYRLHVNGSIGLNGELTSDSPLIFRANNDELNSDGTYKDGEIRFLNGSGVGVQRMIIKNNGDVGIGIDPPGYKFHVNGDGGFVGNLRLTGATTSKLSKIGGGDLVLNAGINGSNLQFTTTESGSEKLRMVIKSDGKIGIGTVTNPVAILHVGGTATIEGITSPVKPTVQGATLGALGMGAMAGGPGAASAWLQSRDSSPLLLNALGINNNGSGSGNSEFVGIGLGTATLLPNYMLGVKGNTVIEGTFAVTKPTAVSPTTNGAIGLGANSTYAWIQSKANTPLLLNSLGNSNPGSGNNIEYVGIGFDPATLPTNGVPKDYMLAVKGNIICQALKIRSYSQWADFVFDKEYKLPALSEVETYINENKRLPGIPSAEEVKNDGFETAEMSSKLLQKIEELTLYMIEQKKESALIKKEVELLKEENTALKKQLSK